MSKGFGNLPTLEFQRLAWESKESLLSGRWSEGSKSNVKHVRDMMPEDKREQKRKPAFCSAKTALHNYHKISVI